jgi:Rod binding domain-containing protein
MAIGALDAKFSAALDAAQSARTPSLAKGSLGKASAANPTVQARAKAQAQDFEAAFLSSMFQQMFSGIQGEGPFGGTQGVGVWRSFLSDEFGKQMAAQGGIGIAPDVYRSLIGQQEAAANPIASQAAAKSAMPVSAH